MLNTNDFDAIVEKINEASSRKQAEDMDTRDVAREYALLSSIAELAAARMKQLAPKLQNDDVDEIFYDLEKKVAMADGSKSYEIDARRLRIDMAKAGRAREFNTIISIKEKDLKGLEDGADLVSKYKHYVGSSAPRLKAIKLSKEEKAVGQQLVDAVKNILK